ncbi:MAG: DUF2997 domain-containing protein [Anaerolineae bacterium]|nr:DUF2997 domain-containing protein [Anaerolineae bacterium]
MSKKQEIEFVIKPDGTVEERVTGVAGPACEKITEDIERALGDIVSRDHSTDYYDQSQGADETVPTHT